MNNAALMLANTTTRICDLGSIPNGSSVYCFATGLGNNAGYLDVWYDWARKGPIGYDAR